MDTTQPRRGLTPAEFFAMALEEGSMQSAHYATRVGYSTIHRAAHGTPVTVPVAKALAEWSAALPAAVAAGVVIDAALAAGIGTGAA